MKNKNEYIIRTCIITRANDKKENLLRFVENSKKEYIFDEQQNISQRAIYIKRDLEVFQKFFKKYKLELESAEKVLKYLSKEKSNPEEELLKILTNLKNSEYLVYGFDENLEAMKTSKIKLLVIPSDVNSKQINKLKKIAKIFKTKIIFIQKQISLKQIFLSEVKVIGITTKKVVKGILNKMEVEK